MRVSIYFHLSDNNNNYLMKRPDLHVGIIILLIVMMQTDTFFHIFRCLSRKKPAKSTHKKIVIILDFRRLMAQVQ